MTDGHFGSRPEVKESNIYIFLCGYIATHGSVQAMSEYRVSGSPCQPAVTRSALADAVLAVKLLCVTDSDVACLVHPANGHFASSVLSAATLTFMVLRKPYQDAVCLVQLANGHFARRVLAVLGLAVRALHKPIQLAVAVAT